MSLVPMYRIAWRSLRTGASGAGTSLFTLAEAQRYADELNVQDASIGLYHWPMYETYRRAPAAPAVTDEPGQGSGSVGMAAGRGNGTAS